ncbi:leucine-rich repeat domain-containing protein [Thermosporothrix hazakensis]|nr:COR domain-containing protein [Thermosporothrix hazakensis]GCE51081.1 hypothetical protein KTH_59500 [Thermosporothrix hazakensis]
MTTPLTDRQIVERLVQEYLPEQCDTKFDEDGHLTELCFSGSGMTTLPASLCELTHLRVLDVSFNEISSLPPEIAHLTALESLILDYNLLITLPDELRYLQQLTALSIGNNQLTEFPKITLELEELRALNLGNNKSLAVENDDVFIVDRVFFPQEEKLYQDSKNMLTNLPVVIWNLRSLRILCLSDNQLTEFPPEIGKMHLTELDLSANRLKELPAEIGKLQQLEVLDLAMNQLREVPAEIGELQQLEVLDLAMNQLREVPAEIGKLQQLGRLDLSENQLREVPAEIGKLQQLGRLDLSENQLREVPAEIGKLQQLRELNLSENQLREVPAEIGELQQLRRLDLSENQLREVPAEIGKLQQLRELNLSDNRQLRRLPVELGNLEMLDDIGLRGTDELLMPPPEIVEQGTSAIRSFLRELQADGKERREAKVMVIGEGGTGKTSLLRALRAEAFEAQSATTHGIRVEQLVFPESSLTLNTWDFGGQHIYHATHQFFLSRRTLYLLVWNARVGVEQSRLDYWLDLIQLHAPDSPVLLVATHTDERAPDLNYQQYQQTYKQLVGLFPVSNRDGTGIDALKSAILEQAEKLPLVGQLWPQRWTQFEQSLQKAKPHHISAEKYCNIARAHGIKRIIAQGTLGTYLHELGKLMYFGDDMILRNLVVLKPNWITKAISFVLTDEAVRQASGILKHEDLPRIWARDDEGNEYEPHLYPIFLRLMERFDLSYQLEIEGRDNVSTKSLVPQLLPFEPPVKLDPWPTSPPDGLSQVEMVYRFEVVPPGVMSRFIVRTHRYTRGLHWRDGVLLEHDGHQARAELNPMARELRLLVWGIAPHNFFVILKATIEQILSDFKGLKMRREVPCICHWKQPGAQPCPRYHRYEDLERRWKAKRATVECPESFEEVSVSQLLYGIHPSTDELIMHDLLKGQKQLLRDVHASREETRQLREQLKQMAELLNRNFARQWNFKMKQLEAECPNVFYLTCGDRRWWNPKDWVSREYRLILLCQHPSGPHPIGEGYPVREAKEWWQKVNPWLHYVVQFLRHGVPLGQALGALYNEQMQETYEKPLAVLEELVSLIPSTLPQYDELERGLPDPHFMRAEPAVGAALRALHSFLKVADPSCEWGGLAKTITPDGNIFWLCPEHRRQYEPRLLVLDAIQ